MSLWQSFRTLQPRTRMYIGVGVMAYSALGLVLSRKAEERFGMVPTDKDRKALREALPKVRSVENG